MSKVKLETKKTTIIFEKNKIDVGNIDYLEDVNIFFVYKNNGKNSLVLKDITTTCGCTVPKWSKKLLKPNNKDSIRVTYDTSIIGYFTKEIMVFSNSESSPDHLFIKGRVIRKEKALFNNLYNIKK